MKRKYIKPTIKVDKKSFITFFFNNRNFDSFDQLLQKNNSSLLAANGICSEGTVMSCGYPRC